MGFIGDAALGYTNAKLASPLGRLSRQNDHRIESWLEYAIFQTEEATRAGGFCNLRRSAKALSLSRFFARSRAPKGTPAFRSQSLYSLD